VSHRNARLTVHGRRLLVQRVKPGSPLRMWPLRWASPGPPLINGSVAGVPKARPACAIVPAVRTLAAVETQVCRLRTTRKLGPARIGPILGLAPSTVHRILMRHHLNRLAWLDRPTAQIIRRYERDRPG
jgi:hypothetical protein